MSALALQGLSKQFSGVNAVRDVTLEIHSGEFFGIVGPSGCGKTTLLRMIAGFEQPSEGRIMLDGRDITAVPAQLRNIGMVFQNYALFPHMTVFQNVAFGLETKRLPRPVIQSAVEKILDAVRLRDKIGVPVPLLSGGEQQRVAVARALVVEPDVLLMDEPLSNLDVTLRATTREEIRSLQRTTRVTTVYVTHDQAEAMSLSDRIAVMRAGNIEQLGTPFDIYETPSSVFVAQFVGGANLLKGEVHPAKGGIVIGGMTIPVPAEIIGSERRQVTIALKPEAISVLPDGHQQAIPAAVEEKEFHGFTTALSVRAFGLGLHVSVPTSGLTKRIGPGDRVGIVIDWSKSTVFPRE